MKLFADACGWCQVWWLCSQLGWQFLSYLSLVARKNHFCHSGAVSKQATIKCGFGSFRVFQEFHQKLCEREPEREPQRATESHMESLCLSLWLYFSVCLSLALSGSLYLSLALSVSLWLSLSLSGSLCLSLARSGSREWDGLGLDHRVR